MFVSLLRCVFLQECNVLKLSGLQGLREGSAVFGTEMPASRSRFCTSKGVCSSGVDLCLGYFDACL